MTGSTDVWVTSKGLCQGEGGGEAVVAVLVDEDGEQDAFHGGAVLEGAHGAGVAADLAETALERVGWWCARPYAAQGLESARR
jgi:hypothetical protein